MHTETSILMRASLERVFEAASDLSRWPDFLPHYRWIRYHERSAERNIVTMAARRKGIPIQWTSEQVIDRTRREVRFLHLKAFTRGMKVVWTFEPTGDGILVRITHDLTSHIPILGPLIADVIIGRFFIEAVAGQTLASMKQYVERPDEP